MAQGAGNQGERAVESVNYIVGCKRRRRGKQSRKKIES